MNGEESSCELEKRKVRKREIEDKGKKLGELGGGSWREKRFVRGVLGDTFREAAGWEGICSEVDFFRVDGVISDEEGSLRKDNFLRGEIPIVWEIWDTIFHAQKWVHFVVSYNWIRVWWIIVFWNDTTKDIWLRTLRAYWNRHQSFIDQNMCVTLQPIPQFSSV